MSRRILIANAILAVIGCGKTNNGIDGVDAGADGGADAAADGGSDTGEDASDDTAADMPIEAPAFTLDCSQYQQSKLKCSSELRGSGGTPVTGRTLADFTVTEARVEEGQILETNVVTFEDSPSYQFDGPGFWEQSLTAAKTDIVFVVDATGTMDDYVAPIRAAIEGLITRLQNDHVDFRMRFVRMESTPSSISPTPFRATMEMDEFRQDMLLAVTSSAEGWSPIAGYDALMQALGNASDRGEFRPDAQPLVVLISDTISASVYGRYWYPPSSTSATVSALKERLARIEATRGEPVAIRYSVPDTAGKSDDPNVGTTYCARGFTPQACELGYDKFAQPLGAWPPSADALYQAVDDLFDDSIADYPVLSSMYHFAWLINLDRGQLNDGQSVAVVVETTLEGEHLVATDELLAELETSDLTVAVRGERGEVPEAVTFKLYSVLGNRNYLARWDNTIQAGEQTFYDIPCGEYLMALSSSSVSSADYNVMRHGHVGMIELCGEQRIELDLRWADRQADLALARGLVDDLALWGPIDRPFDGFAGDVDTWLDQLDQQGMDWHQYSGLKRLIVTLGAYANTTGYATVEVKAAAADFKGAASELRRLIRQLDDTKTSTEDALFDPSTASLLTYYSTPPNVNPDAVEKYTLEEVALNTLKDYLTGPFLTEALTRVSGIIGDNVNNAQLAALVIQFAVALVSGDWDDLDDLIARIAQVGLQVALDETADQVSALVGQLVADEIDQVSDPQATMAVKQLVKKAVSAILDVGLEALRSDSTGSVQAELDSLAQTARNELGSRENLVAAIDLVFAQVHSELDYGAFRNFVWPMLHALVRALAAKEEVDADFVLEALATQFANRLIVYPFYADPLEQGLRDAFDAAKAWQAQGSFYDEYSALSAVGSDCRYETMRPLNDDAWDILATQSSIDDWENWMTTGRSILGVLESVTLAACVYYPQLCDPATDEIPTLMNVLSGLRVMTNIFQLAIRMNFLEEMASRVDNCNSLIFPVP